MFLLLGEGQECIEAKYFSPPYSPIFPTGYPRHVLMMKADVHQWNQKHVSTIVFQVSACVPSASISLAKLSHMTTVTIRRHINRLCYLIHQKVWLQAGEENRSH